MELSLSMTCFLCVVNAVPLIQIINNTQELCSKINLKFRNGGKIFNPKQNVVLNLQPMEVSFGNFSSDIE